MTQSKFKGYFKIKPLDTMFFGSNFVIKKKVNNIFQSFDFPYPSVFYGTIFSEFLRQGYFKETIEKIKKVKPHNNKEEIRKEINEELKYNLNIDAIFIFDEENKKFFVKAPLDLFENKYNISIGIFDDRFMYNPKDYSSTYERTDGKYIDIYDLITYYSEGKVKDIKLYDRNYFFTNYMKTGIQINKDKKIAEDELLYRLNMVEFTDKRFSFLVKYTSSNELKNNKGILKFGGEAKQASFIYTKKSIKCLEDLWETYNKIIITGNKVKIILTSPMIITKEQEMDKFKICVTGKPQYIGGFDLVKKEAKPLRKAIPSGSVLVLEDEAFKGKTVNEVFNMISEYLPETQDSFRGFGKIIIMPFVGGKDNE